MCIMEGSSSFSLTHGGKRFLFCSRHLARRLGNRKYVLGPLVQGRIPTIRRQTCISNLPFPLDTTPLEAIGETYHETRRQIMLARWEGLTKTYNHFHDPDITAADIQELRDLHVEMDRQVAAAYDWDDLALEHGYHETAQGLRFTISEAARREVLTRLLKLNHERFAEECRQGLHTTKKGKQACAEFFAKHPRRL